MPVAELLGLIKDQPGIHPRLEEPLSRHLPLRVGGPVELWIEVDDEHALECAMSAARQTKGRWRIHWPFSDWLVRDGGLKGTVIRLGQGFEHMVVTDDSITLGSTALWSAIPAEMVGDVWDAIRGWPGSVGGLFALDRQHELAGLCTRIRVLKAGRIQQLDVLVGEAPPALSDATVLSSVTLRRCPPTHLGLTPPPPVGTLFASVVDTEVGRELLKAGVCGTRLRRWRLSKTEPGTVVQLGGGNLRDLQMLVQGIRNRVEKIRGIKLETRIPVLGNEPGRRN